MAIFRVEKIRDYTVMSNHHLKNRALSLKAKGLLSLILSLPNEWDFTMKGLAAISVEGVDAIRQVIVELENQGYVVRSRVRDSRGHLRGAEYVIYEQPRAIKTAEPVPDAPTHETPTPEASVRDEPIQDISVQGLPTQLNTYREKTYQSNNLTAANPYLSHPSTVAEEAPMGRDEIGSDTAATLRNAVHQRISYDTLLCDSHIDQGRLDEIVEIMVEMLCSKKGVVNIAGRNYDISFVQARMLQLSSLHIQYVFHCLNQNKSQIRNIKSYLLAVLFNAPATMESYYAAKISEDLAGMDVLTSDELPDDVAL